MFIIIAFFLVQELHMHMQYIYNPCTHTTSEWVCICDLCGCILLYLFAAVTFLLRRVIFFLSVNLQVVGVWLLGFIVKCFYMVPNLHFPHPPHPPFRYSLLACLAHYHFQSNLLYYLLKQQVVGILVRVACCLCIRQM